VPQSTWKVFIVMQNTILMRCVHWYNASTTSSVGRSHTGALNN